MTQQNHLLAIDLGAESGRAILGTLNDGKLALAEVHRFPNVPVRLSDGLHWDILRLWTDIKNALALAIRKCGKQSLSIGVDTWGVDFGLLNRRGALIENPYHYRDNRTDGMVACAFKRLPREKIFECTGIQFMQLNTLYQLLAMVVNRSPALKIAETFLTIPDLFNYWLTGEIAVSRRDSGNRRPGVVTRRRDYRGLRAHFIHNVRQQRAQHRAGHNDLWKNAARNIQRIEQ